MHITTVSFDLPIFSILLLYESKQSLKIFQQLSSPIYLILKDWKDTK